MDNITNDDYLKGVFEGDFANHGATVFEPLTRAASDGYQNLASRGEPYAAMKQGGSLRGVEMAGSQGGQMPTADALQNMNQSLGLTSRRYGATAPDARSVEAIASRNIDKMGLMEPETVTAFTPGKNSSRQASGYPGGGGTGMPSPENMRAIEAEASRYMENRRKEIEEGGFQALLYPKKPYQSPQSAPARPVQAQYASEEDVRLIRQFASSIGKERFQKLVNDLSKMAAKIPGEMSKRRSSDPTTYLRYLAGDKSGRR